jgi:hypothetical protein
VAVEASDTATGAATSAAFSADTSTTAKDASVAAKVASEAARDVAVAARDVTVAAKDVAVIASDEAAQSAADAQAAAQTGGSSSNEVGTALDALGLRTTAVVLSSANVLDNQVSGIRSVSTANVDTVNGPLGAVGGVVVTTYFGPDNLKQEYKEISGGGRMFARHKDTSGWQPWREIFDETNFPGVASLASRRFRSVAHLLADTQLSYAGTSALTDLNTGDYVTAGAHTYVVESSGSGTANYDVITAGGIKLSVVPVGRQEYHMAAFGIDPLGIADIQPIWQRAIDRAAARATDTLFVFTAGLFKVGGEVSFAAYPATNSGPTVGIVGPGSSQCVFKPTAFGRAKAVLNFGGGSTSNRYNAPLLRGFRIEGARAAGEPMGVFWPYMGTDSQIDDVKIQSLANVGWYTYEIDNCDFQNIVVTSCGYQVQDRIFDETVYCRVIGSVITAYDASGARKTDAFSSRTNGRMIAIANADDAQPEIFTISDYLGVNNDGYATLDHAPQNGNLTFTQGASDNHKFSYCIPEASTASGSNQMAVRTQLFDSTWIGCPIMVKGAGTGGSFLHCRIAAVAGNTITLDTTAPRTTTNAQIYTGFAMIVARPRNVENNAVLTNDVQINNLRIEGYNGIGLFVEYAANFVMDASKIHGRTDEQNNFGNSAHAVVLDRCSGGSSGVMLGDGCEFEHGLSPNSGRILVTGSNCKAYIGGAHGRNSRDSFPVFYEADGANTYLSWCPSAVANNWKKSHVGTDSVDKRINIMLGANVRGNYNDERSNSGEQVCDIGHTEISHLRAARQVNLSQNEKLIVDINADIALIMVNSGTQNAAGLVQVRTAGPWKTDIGVGSNLITSTSGGTAAALSNTFGAADKLHLVVCNDKLVLLNRFGSGVNVSFTLLSTIG